MFFFAKEDRFLMLFQTCTQPTFGLSDIFVITVIARNRIDSVGSVWQKYAPKSEKAYFLTPIYTSSKKKGQLLSERLKGSLFAAFRSPLMKAQGKNVDTLGL